MQILLRGSNESVNHFYEVVTEIIKIWSMVLWSKHYSSCCR